MKQVSLSKNDKKKYHSLLDKIFETCYIDPLTGRFHCKECNNAVHVDLSQKVVYCPVHGMLI